MATMIKFRAWDKLSNMMYTPTSIKLINGEVVQADIEDNSLNISDDLNTLLLEQFTGLKDVNGKDIYEGDIVKVWSDMSELTMVPVINEIVSEDLFGRPGVFLKPAGPHLIEPCLHDSWSNQFEVIGNVHANPELLEADK